MDRQAEARRSRVVLFGSDLSFDRGAQNEIKPQDKVGIGVFGGLFELADQARGGLGGGP